MPELVLPIVHVEAETLPEAWERAVVETWEKGVTIKTQYDKPDDPPSKDATAIIAVSNPLGEPMIHRAIPGGLEDLVKYELEVVQGIHDHWIDPEHGKWQYTYHERLTAYSVPGEPEPIDQIEYIVECLAEAEYSRRAQAITWKPWMDAGDPHPACLQRIWCRVIDGKLCMNIHIRSNDAYKAAFMNMYAFVKLQEHIAERLSEKVGRKIPVGQYTHIADSFHIYGSYFEEFQGFLETLKQRTFEQRTWHTAQVADILQEARAKIKEELERER